jgi:hypothetical protein
MKNFEFIDKKNRKIIAKIKAKTEMEAIRKYEKANSTKRYKMELTRVKRKGGVLDYIP